MRRGSPSRSAGSPADLQLDREALDINEFAIKRLLNHKMSNNVTAGYIVTDVERLRAPMQEGHRFHAARGEAARVKKIAATWSSSCDGTPLAERRSVRSMNSSCRVT
jgi:hypothetical protein